MESHLNERKLLGGLKQSPKEANVQGKELGLYLIGSRNH
jgi:hypothetical protein